jgi:hypothetical protein
MHLTDRYFGPHLGALGSLPVVAVGCAAAASAEKPVEKPSPTTVSVERYMPLRDATVYAYRTRDEGTGEQGILIQEISRPRPNRAEIRVAGRVRMLDISTAEVRFSDGGVLLAAPLRRGAVWQGREGQVEVTAVQMRVEVPAGRYSGCLETRETSNPTGHFATITTVYCPDVGVVRLEVEGSTGDDILHEVAELMSYGPRVDLGTEEKAPE